MAMIRLANGQEKTLTAEQGAEIWAILQGDEEGTAEQQAFCLQVKKLYLNWRNAPDSYIERYKDIIFPMVVGEWMSHGIRYPDGHVTTDGRPTRPDPLNNINREFSKKWGLLDGGNHTQLALKYM